MEEKKWKKSKALNYLKMKKSQSTKLLKNENRKIFKWKQFQTMNK